jgi:ammonium transporter, Amt family
MIGTISLGLFAAGTYGAATATGADTSAVVTGLFYGGGVSLLWTQFYGTTIVAIVVLAVSLALMYGVKATGTLRVSKAGELEGLDLHEHGVAAYPEFSTAFGRSIVMATNGTNGTATPHTKIGIDGAGVVGGAS